MNNVLQDKTVSKSDTAIGTRLHRVHPEVSVTRVMEAHKTTSELSLKANSLCTYTYIVGLVQCDVDMLIYIEIEK